MCWLALLRGRGGKVRIASDPNVFLVVGDAGRGEAEFVMHIE